MKKTTLALSAALLTGFAIQGQAQVKDMTFTVAPTASYNWWNNHINLGESAFWGARAGFALGPVFELRASYERSYNLKGKLQGSGWSPISSLGNRLEGSDVKIERWGGELKFNLIPYSSITPFIAAGGGVMNIKQSAIAPATQDYKEELLFASLGAGVKFNVNRRIAFTLEAKDYIFNLATNSQWREAGYTSDKALHNFGAQATLDFYLGGRNNPKDEVSKIYRNYYSSGLRGLRFVLEPGVAYVNFDDESIMRDSWFLGGSAGVDFSDTFGLRGFYYANTRKANKLDFHTNSQVQLYGGNFIARLNYLRGVTPYLTLGGGYMKVDTDRYEDALGTNTAKSGYFAMGGAGLEIPLHKYVSLYGNINAMINESDNPDLSEIYTPSQVKVNLMYQAGLRFNIGASARSGRAAYQSYANDLLSQERDAHLEEINKLRASNESELKKIQEAKNKEINKLRSTYEAQIQDLDSKLRSALEQNDTLQVIRLANERDLVEANKQQLTALAAPTVIAPSVESDKKTVTLTVAQLNELVSRVVQESKPAVQQGATDQILGSSLSDLDKILLFSALSNGQLRLPQAGTPLTLQSLQSVQPQVINAQPTVEAVSSNKALEEKTDILLKKIEDLEKQMERNQRENVYRQYENRLLQSQTAMPVVSGLNSNVIATPTTSTNTQPQQMSFISVDENGKVKTTSYDLKEVSYLRFQNLRAFAGVNFGDATAFVLGIRPEWQFGDSKFYLAPEAFFGFGSDSAFGLSANALYKFNLNQLKDFNPYVGLGLGYSNIGSESRFNTNVILGASLNNVLGGRFSVDYTIRGLFRNNQITAGYTFTF